MTYRHAPYGDEVCSLIDKGMFPTQKSMFPIANAATTDLCACPVVKKLML